MKKITAILFFLYLAAPAIDAQLSAVNHISLSGKDRGYRDTVWIITGKKFLDGHFHRWKMDLILDARYTLVSSTRARLAGLRIGMEYRRVHRFGVGIYNLGDGVVVDTLAELGPQVDTAVLNLSYTSIFYERVIFFSPRWEFSLTAHLGSGQITGKYLNQGTETWLHFPVRKVRPVELSGSLYFHPTWWLSIGGGVGYRFMRSTPDEVRPIYNAPVAIAKVRIRLGRLVKSIWDKEVKYEY